LDGRSEEDLAGIGIALVLRLSSMIGRVASRFTGFTFTYTMLQSTTQLPRAAYKHSTTHSYATSPTSTLAVPQLSSKKSSSHTCQHGILRTACRPPAGHANASIHQVDTFLALFNTSTNTINKAFTPAIIATFDGTLKSIVDTLDPDTVKNFVTSFKTVTKTFDRAITENTLNHVDNTLAKIESTFTNIDAITSCIRSSTIGLIAVLLIWLGVSMLLNVALFSSTQRMRREIADLKDRSKKSS
jgi:hypothetical protein